MLSAPKSVGDSEKTPRKKHSHPIHRLIAKWSRWLHIYLSLASLAVIFFFSITGLTLNHPDWFFSESTVEQKGHLDVAWLNNGAQPPAGWDDNDFGHQVDKLSVVEHLRSEHGLTGKMTDFLTFAEDCEVTFQGPGYAATARIPRSSGDYTVAITRNDLVSVLNDLHKGRNSGRVWSVVIDMSAILSTIVAISGFMLIFYLRIKRNTRLLVAGVGLVVCLLLVWIAIS